MFVRTLMVIALLAAAAFPTLGQEAATEPNTNLPGYPEGDFVVYNYKFVSGESWTLWTGLVCAAFCVAQPN